MIDDDYDPPAIPRRSRHGWNGSGLMVTPSAWTAEDPRLTAGSEPAWCPACRTERTAEETYRGACGKTRCDLPACEQRHLNSCRTCRAAAVRDGSVYPCDRCGRVFVWRSAYVDHLDVHELHPMAVKP